eukprot:TRINITY_DN14994_c1_g1_i2.p1 TRINITY_DN14994_c1_g1~~TRINITY_DN14994_c1_g1_i2.p1  ORF type:complete len:1185 (-),score=302.51 TRINITY_DN14994_c1_g1_i2:98-3652(-)
MPPAGLVQHEVTRIDSSRQAGGSQTETTNVNTPVSVTAAAAQRAAAPAAAQQQQQQQQQESRSLAPSLVARMNSDAYWNADSWDPDERVYTNAEGGGANHLLAVKPDATSSSSTAAASPQAEPAKSQQEQAAATPKVAHLAHGDLVKRMNSDAYWNAESWDPDERVYTNAEGGGANHLMAVKPDADSSAGPTPQAEPAKAEPAPSAKTPQAAAPAPETLKRTNSDAYWNAEGWDPDERVYTNAEGGGANHLMAVKPDAAASAASPTPQGDAAKAQPAPPANSPQAVGGDAEVPRAASSSGARLLRADSEAYWDSDQWNPDERVYVGASSGQTHHVTAVEDKEKRTQPASNSQQQQAGYPRQEARPALSREDSAKYWDAAGWDPDQRVYVGAEAGQHHHQTAVEPDEEKKAAEKAAERSEEEGQTTPRLNSRIARAFPTSPRWAVQPLTPRGGAVTPPRTVTPPRGGATKTPPRDATPPRFGMDEDSAPAVAPTKTGSPPLAPNVPPAAVDVTAASAVPCFPLGAQTAATTVKASVPDAKPVTTASSAAASPLPTQPAAVNSVEVTPKRANDSTATTAVSRSQDVPPTQTLAACNTGAKARRPPGAAQSKGLPKGPSGKDPEADLGFSNSLYRIVSGEPDQMPDPFFNNFDTPAFQEIAHMELSEDEDDMELEENQKAGFGDPSLVTPVKRVSKFTASAPREVPLGALMRRCPVLAIRRGLSCISLHRASKDCFVLNELKHKAPQSASASSSCKASLSEAKCEEDSSHLSSSQGNSDVYWNNSGWINGDAVFVEQGKGKQPTQTERRSDLQDQMETQAASKDAIQRIWVQGLSSVVMGLESEPGPTIDITQLQATVQELYEYTMEGVVGTGGFGVCHAARHRVEGRSCVVKAIDKAAAGRPYRTHMVEGGLLERLLKMSREVPHRNVVRYLDMLESGRYYYVVMERLRGKELLEEVLERFPVTEFFCQDITRQLLKALNHLHNKVRLFHRDVKMANLRYRGRKGGSHANELCLLDFGFTGALDDDRQDAGQWERAVCGTLMFMAPEVIGGKVQRPYVAAMDLWAVGVVLYMLLTGKAPFTDAEVKSLGDALREEGPNKDELMNAAKARIATAFEAKELASSSPEAVGLLRQLLVVEPSCRMSAVQALQHPWFFAYAEVRRVGASSASYRKLKSVVGSLRSVRHAE